MHEYTKQIQDEVIRIGKAHNLLPSEKIFKIKIQDENSSIEIPDLGKKFGSTYDENGDLILANWLFDLSTKEQKILVDFILIREAFRFYFRTEIGKKADNYERFTDIILQIVTMLWICEQNKLQLTSAPLIAIKGRADAFDEEDILKSEYWVYFITQSFQLDITSLKLFPVIIEQVKDSLEKERPIYDLAWNTYYWLKAHFPEVVSDALPKYINKKRHYELIKIISETEFNDCSAVNLGKITNRSYNVVNRDFQQIMDEYGLFWWSNINLLKLKLYPYFFRINVNRIEQKNKLIEKLKTNRYVRNLKECEIKNKALIVGWLECPLIAYEQLADYFEKLQKNGHIEEFFFKQIRRKRNTWSITNKQLQPDAKTYQKIFADPSSVEFKTITAIDEAYNISSAPGEKKEIFDKDVVMFFTSILNHHIGKSHYKFLPLDLIYDLCEKNNVDSSNTSEVTYYINLLDQRCRRLGIYDYILSIRRAHSFDKALYIELNDKPESEKSQILIQKLLFVSELEFLSFNDRFVFILPEVKYKSLFREELEKILSDSKMQYQIYQLNSHQGLRVPYRFLYNEAYDFEEGKWKF